MKKILMTLAAVLCCILTLHAQPISEQEAMERALQYMNSNRSSANARRMATPALRGSKALTPAATEATKIYAFDIEGGGFVIASGDQRTLPVLGYSTTGSIDWSQMPENMRSWLKSYDKAIATLDGRTDFEDGEQAIIEHDLKIGRPVFEVMRILGKSVLTTDSIRDLLQPLRETDKLEDGQLNIDFKFY